jgi:hypothetical protein
MRVVFYNIRKKHKRVCVKQKERENGIGFWITEVLYHNTLSERATTPGSDLPC